jgi:oligoendopeptidase F
MWAVKGHYYISSLDFYNFPYAFGLLFGLGLYSRYEEAGADFIPEYDKILLGTGLKSAEEVCAQAGFDITRRDFWQSGIDVLARRIDDYENFK